jgi:dephospho-CoA kinase
MRLCDFVITNNEQEMVIPQILDLHQQLLQKATVKSQELLSKDGENPL